MNTIEKILVALISVLIIAVVVLIIYMSVKYYTSDNRFIALDEHLFGEPDLILIHNILSWSFMILYSVLVIYSKVSLLHLILPILGLIASVIPFILFYNAKQKIIKDKEENVITSRTDFNNFALYNIINMSINIASCYLIFDLFGNIVPELD